MNERSDETPQKAGPTSTKTFFPPNCCRFPGTPTKSPLNPGSMADLHKKTRDLTPHWIEGLNVKCAKNFDVHRAFYAEWMMGNNTPAGFRFGGMLCRKDDDRTTKSPVIVGDVNPSSLASNLQLTYHPIPELKLESKIQTGTFPFASQVCKTTSILEYSPGRSTISLAVRNPKRQSGGVTFGILQRFTNNFCAGAELLVAWSEKNRVQADVALAGRYSFPKSSLAATVSKGAMDVSFWHQPSDNLQVGASLNYNNRTSKAIGSLCYQLEMKKATIKGMIDTDWTIGCTYDSRMKNLASMFGFSVLYCVSTSKFYCGLKYELNSNLIE